MLTQCPQCDAVFRISAANLSIAHGFVVCGECEAVFSALNHLADEPPPIGQPISPVPAIESTPIPAVINLDTVPAVLRDDVERLLHRQRIGLHGVWSLVALIAAIALLTQIAWADRDWIFEHYPNLQPYALQMCERLGCRIEQPRGRARIELVARDVREHPQYVDALLVNATFANRGKAVVNFPVIELGVYDRNGGVIGLRRFQPTEYLDQSIDIAAGMSPGRSVYVVLELARTAKVAESFEFNFL